MLGKQTASRIYCWVDEHSNFAYWLENGIMRAPIEEGEIQLQSQERLDFDTISSNVGYYMHIIDELEAHR